MYLNGKQRHFLRGLAHHKSVVVTVGGAGLSENVSHEIDLALQHHELIKIKLPELERGERKALLEQIGASSQAEIVQQIGRIGVLYRAAEKPGISLP